MINLQLVKQRREDMLREAQMSRRTRALRATSEPRAGRESTLAWEIKRHAGRVLKFLRASRNAAQ